MDIYGEILSSCPQYFYLLIFLVSTVLASNENKVKTGKLHQVPHTLPTMIRLKIIQSGFKNKMPIVANTFVFINKFKMSGFRLQV